MQLDAHLDLDLVAVETDSDLATLVTITAPDAPADEARPPLTLVVALDRSGSMAGPRLHHAQRALADVVQRLRPDDRFGLVVFDDEVLVPVPAGPLTDKQRVLDAIASVHPGGTTDLGAGYLRALQEARRVSADAGATVLLISDGHANRGVTDPGRLSAVAGTAAARRVTTSALGVGLGYDETLLSAVARGGLGNEMFAEDADAAAARITDELGGLLEQSVQAASLLVRLSPHVAAVRLVNELPATMTDDGLMVELGGFYAGETRRLVLELAVPGLGELGLAEVASLELRFIDVGRLVEQTVCVPLHVNVVPGDQAAGRVPDPVVRTELAYQQAQGAKRRASRLLVDGDGAGAASELRGAAQALTACAAAAPESARADVVDELATLARLTDDAEWGDASRTSKTLSEDVTYKSGRRGRRRSA